MPDQSVPADASFDAPLQFDNAHPGETPTAICTSCSKPIVGVYHEANGKVVCSRCRGDLEVFLTTSGGMRRFRRAVGFGLGAAIGCGILYGAFRVYSDWDFSLITILVGFLVGKAVFIGGERRGGRRYQVLAVLMTYLTLAASFVPIAVQEFKDKDSPLAVADSAKTAAKGDSVATPGATTDANTASFDSALAVDLPTATKIEEEPPLGFAGVLLAIGGVLVLMMALPIMVGMASIMSVFIMGVGLWQAWQMNKAVVINVSGPYRLADPPMGAEPATI